MSVKEKGPVRRALFEWCWPVSFEFLGGRHGVLVERGVLSLPSCRLVPLVVLREFSMR